MNPFSRVPQRHCCFFSALQQSSATLHFCRVPVKICISSINTTTKILGADVMSDESELLLHVYL